MEPLDHADYHQFDVDFRHFEVTSVKTTAASKAELQLRAGDAPAVS